MSNIFEKAVQLVNTMGFDLSHWFVRTPTKAKSREFANRGKKSKVVMKRRRQRDIAYESRRANRGI